MDWEKWMERNHVKLRGEPNDNGANAGKTGGGISRPEVASPPCKNGRQTGCGNLQVHAANRAAKTKKAPKEK